MTPERWQQIKELVNSVAAEDGETRSAVLQQSCADDLPLRRGAEALLSLREDPTRRFLDQQAPLAPAAWQRIEQLFQAALELQPAERAAFLAQECGENQALRHEVESLLVYQAAAGDLIGGAIQQAAGLLPNTSEVKARFTPGTTLNKRYRIIGLLGRGGMGEVYRADDLKLGHPVALKFLTEQLSQDKAMLARFHSEVSMAHRVTHPNVCRVHDIGEVTTSAGTLHFLTMEYVDGEDLSSLLRRIGRLPSDKAVEIANQLCAGLTAAHEAGVLHRDLKPANVMIDGKGRVRITDFGLAGFAEQIRGSEVMAGTPAYMSPEQFAGREVTAKSDLYALGLVLYEVFTGKRVFEAASLQELQRLHESSSPTNPSNWVKDIDPLVERVILRCLEKDPAKRLASAKQVADALPGGDPLAAALALGETPSPEMVAAAGSKTGMKPAHAVACLLAIIAGLAVFALLGNKTAYLPKVARDHSPEVLSHKAREIAQSLGYKDQPVHQAWGFNYDYEYQQYVEQKIEPGQRRAMFAKDRLPVLYYWHRESPWPLMGIGFNSDGWVSSFDPPLDVSGMLHVRLDPQGRLLTFDAVPPQVDQANDTPPPPDWAALFAAAQLDLTSFSPTQPQWTPQSACDVRAAWTGKHPALPEFPLRIEAAAYRGKPVYLQLIWPWTRPSRMQDYQLTTRQQVGFTIFLVVFASVLLGAMLLARRNIRLGRGDQRGAFRLAAFIFAVKMLVWLFGAEHLPSPIEGYNFLLNGVKGALLWSGIIWLIYLALEPFARKRWPVTLVSWGRLLSGKLRDPLIGRDLLIGVLAAVIMQLLYSCKSLISNWRGSYDLPYEQLAPLRGLRFLVADGFMNNFFRATLIGLMIFFMLFLLRLLTRRQWLASGVFVLLGVVQSSVAASDPLLSAVEAGLGGILIVVLLLRFGLLALVAEIFVENILGIPVTTDLSAWYAGASLSVLFVTLALASYAFHTSLGGQKVFAGKLLEE